jgi:hypothetical protein
VRLARPLLDLGRNAPDERSPSSQGEGRWKANPGPRPLVIS